VLTVIFSCSGLSSSSLLFSGVSFCCSPSMSFVFTTCPIDASMFFGFCLEGASLLFFCSPLRKLFRLVVEMTTPASTSMFRIARRLYPFAMAACMSPESMTRASVRDLLLSFTGKARSRFRAVLIFSGSNFFISGIACSPFG